MNKKVQLEQLCQQIQPIAEADLEAARRHWDNVAKPLKGLGKLEDLIARIAAVQQCEEIVIGKKAIVVMCGDNGIVEAGVTQSGSDVTAIVAENMARGLASVNRMAAVAGAAVIPVDIGMVAEGKIEGVIDSKLGRGTQNFLNRPAMSQQQVLEGILTGIRLVGRLKAAGYALLGTGEMGIGNTTTSSAVAAVLLRRSPREVTGRGAGLSNGGLEQKVRVIERGIALHRPDPGDVYAVLAALGGFDIAGLTGVFLGGAIYRVPIVMDGMISMTAALAAGRICPLCTDYMLASHLGKEPASQFIMDELGLSPVIYAELGLGEGTGAVLLFPMLDMANAVYRANMTFAEINVKAYEKFD